MVYYSFKFVCVCEISILYIPERKCNFETMHALKTKINQFCATQKTWENYNSVYMLKVML